MNAYKIIISYDGSHYSGFQFQTENPNTIQEIIQTALNSLLETEYKISFASRTDKGVHAQGQVLKLSVPLKLKNSFLNEINHLLPEDIQFIDISSVDPKFNPNMDVLSKTYHYKILTQDLDRSLMKNACSILIGEHDFCQFTVPGKREKNTQREILACKLTSLDNDYSFFEIKATGYLKYMIRFLVYALIEIGKGKLSLKNFKGLLNGNEIYKLKKAPAEGLTLHHIDFVTI